jgi:hypothetical protein
LNDQHAGDHEVHAIIWPPGRISVNMVLLYGAGGMEQLLMKPLRGKVGGR